MNRGAAGLMASASLICAARLRQMQHADSRPTLLRIGDDILVIVIGLDLLPEAFDVAFAFGMGRHIVHGDHAAASHQRGVKFKILFNALALAI